MPEKTDHEWATEFDMSDAEFFDNPDLSFSTPDEDMAQDVDFFNKYYTCGDDDAQLDHSAYLQRVTTYQDEYASFKGEGTEDGYLKFNEDGIGFTSFENYVIFRELLLD